MKKNRKIALITSLMIMSPLAMNPSTVNAEPMDFYYSKSDKYNFSYFSTMRNIDEHYTVMKHRDEYYMEGNGNRFYKMTELYPRLQKSDKGFYETTQELDAYLKVDRIVSDLDSVLNNNNLDSSKSYTKESLDRYAKAKNNLEEIKKTRFIKESDYNKLKQEFALAYNLLEEENADTTKLKALRDSAVEKLKGNYTEESKKQLSASIEKVDKILKMDKHKKKDVDAATLDLQSAIAKLVEQNRIVHIKNPKAVTVNVGVEVKLPEIVTAVYENEKEENVKVKWNLEGVDFSKPGKNSIEGTVENTDIKAHIDVEVKAVINKENLKAKINEANEKLGQNISVEDKNRLNSELIVANEILNKSSNQNEIDREAEALENIISNIKGIAEIRNVKPDKKIYVQENEKVKISFDSIPGGKARFDVSMPTRMFFRSFMPMNFMVIEPEANMVETPANSGHYEGEWIVPEGFYGNDYTISLFLRMPDGTELDKETEGIINVTNNIVVKYIANDEIIGTESVTAGETLKNIPVVKKEGYVFKGWKINGEKVDNLAGLKINESEEIVAIMEPIKNVSYSVKYVDKTGKVLAEEKFVTDKSFAEKINEEAKVIDGYKPDEELKSIKLGMNNNVITFVYSPREDIPYKVKYQCNGETIKVEDEKRGTYLADNKVEVPEIAGYVPENKNQNIKLEKTSGNEIVLNYKPREDVPYEVKYMKELENGKLELLDSVTSTGTFNSTVTLANKDYVGLRPVEKDPKIKLSNADNNEIIVKYVVKSGIPYNVECTDSEGNNWTLEYSGKFGEKITVDDIKKKELIHGGQEYKIKSFDGSGEIVLDDRADRNNLSVNVYKVYNVEKNQDLKNLYNEANKIEIPDYAQNNPDWKKYADKFEGIKSKFENEEVNEYNVEELTRELKDSIDIVKKIKDYDSAWNDRTSPRGFAKTVNVQCTENKDVYGRLKVYYNPYESLIKIGMNENQMERSFLNGAVGVGVKTAMLNVLSSDGIYQVESKGVVAQIQDENGNKKPDNKLVSEGASLAATWLPKGMTITGNKWKELIGQPRVEFIIRGKTAQGTLFERTYYFEFVDKKDL